MYWIKFNNIATVHVECLLCVWQGLVKSIYLRMGAPIVPSLLRDDIYFLVTRIIEKYVKAKTLNNVLSNL